MRFAQPARDGTTANSPSPYRSEGQRSIADMLSEYGIPFFYDQPILVVENGHKCIEYVDFFLPTYAGLSMDYLANPTTNAYKRKMRLYRENEVPAVLLTRQDISGRGWQRRIHDRLDRVYHGGLTYRLRGKYK